MRKKRGMVFLAAVGLSLFAVSVSACSGGNDSLADQYRSGDNKGYIAGDSGITEIAPEDRGDPVVFSGTTADGSTISSSDYAGEPVVVNFWYAACGPCRAEASRLEKSAQDLADTPVAFVGVNTYDQAETARAFDQKYGITYPSIMDADDKKVAYAFSQEVPLASTPVTVVLDQQGRVAARIIGEVPEASILTSIAKTVAAEKS